jgi:hypothetical protein
MIHLTEARKIIESGEPISIGFFKANGEKVEADNVVCTSSNFHNNTFTLKFKISNQFRKIHAVLVYHVNGTEVAL